MRLGWSAALIAFALVGVSCGGGDTSPRTLSCPGDEIAMLSVLRSGLPTLDYDPAVDLDHLIQRGDVVVSGILRTAVRESGDDLDTTVIEVSDARILAGEPPGPVTTFSTSSKWTVPGETDPLEATVTFEGLSFFAVLDRFEPAVGGYRLDVQGLHVTCDSGSGRLRNVIEPLPDPARGSTLRLLVQMLS